MLFLLILPVLVAGFFACHIHPVYSYKLHRYEGQYLYLKSAELGLKCFSIALLLALGGHYSVPDSVSFFCHEINLNLSAYFVSAVKVFGAQDDFEAKKMAWFFLLSFLLFVAAFLVKLWGNFRLLLRFGRWDARVFVIGQLLEDSPLDNLLFRLSMEKDKSVMISLSDRKVYVGKVINLGEPSETSGMDQDISIIPLMSGYRDKDDLTVEFTTYYEETGGNLYISIRQDAIVSATEFDFSSHQKWTEKKLKKENVMQISGSVVPGKDEWHLTATYSKEKK